MTLTKIQIVESVQNHIGSTQEQIFRNCRNLLEIIKSTLAAGEDVLVSGFGKFCVKEKKERKWRNHRTGKFEMLPPKRLVTFKCSGKLRERA